MSELSPSKREAMYAEAIYAAQAEAAREVCKPEDFANEARAVLPLVAAEVEAAVSVVRAEAQSERANADYLAERADIAEAKIARVEALHGPTSTNGNGPDYCKTCSDSAFEWVQWPCAVAKSLTEKPKQDVLSNDLERLAAVPNWPTALPDPTTPDQEGGAEEPCVCRTGFTCMARIHEGGEGR